jgi:hypothetical protein
MKSNELVVGEVYKDICDKDVPLLYEGKIVKGVNNGYNDYFDIVTFKTVKTDKNKNWDIPEFIEKSFNDEIGNSTIVSN